MSDYLKPYNNLQIMSMIKKYSIPYICEQIMY